MSKKLRTGNECVEDVCHQDLTVPRNVLHRRDNWRNARPCWTLQESAKDDEQILKMFDSTPIAHFFKSIKTFGYICLKLPKLNPNSIDSSDSSAGCWSCGSLWDLQTGLQPTCRGRLAHLGTSVWRRCSVIAFVDGPQA